MSNNWLMVGLTLRILSVQTTKDRKINDSLIGSVINLPWSNMPLNNNYPVCLAQSRLVTRMWPID